MTHAQLAPLRQPLPKAAALESRAGARTLLAMVATVEFALGFNLLSVSGGLPLLAAELGGGVVGAGWAMTAYLLTFSSLLVLAGRAGDSYGHARLYLGGMLTYALGALGCGLAGSMPLLLAARVVQGVGAAMLSGNGLALTASAFVGQRRSLAVGTMAMASTLGALSGVVAGTFFRAELGWRGAFLLALPVLLLAFGLALAARVAGQGRPATGPEQPAASRTWNPASAVGLVVAMAALFLSLNHLHEGEETFQAGWGYHTAMQVVALLALGVFIVSERRSSSPLFLQPALATLPFVSAVLANGALHMTMIGVVFLTPFLLESALGMPAAATGWMLIALHAATAPMNLAGGWLYERLGPRISRVSGMFTVAAGFAVMGWLAPLGRLELLLGLGVVISVGLGAFVTANNLVAVNAAPAQYRGLATGALETTRQLGHALSVAVVALLIGPGAQAGGPAALLDGSVRSILAMATVALVGMFLSLPVGRPRR